MNLTSKQSLIAIVVLAVICIFLGAQLYIGNKNYDDLTNEYGQLEIDKEQVVFDLEKMRFSYDTLQTENSMMIAEIAAQRDRVDLRDHVSVLEQEADRHAKERRAAARCQAVAIRRKSEPHRLMAALKQY